MNTDEETVDGGKVSAATEASAVRESRMSDNKSEYVHNSVYQKTLEQAMGRKHKIQAMNGQIASLEERIKALESDAAEAQKTIEAVTGERDGLKSQLSAAPGEHQAELDRLRGEIRTRSHQDKFNQLAKDRIRPDALAAAWKLAGWKPEGDDVDEAAMEKSIASLIEGNAFLGSASDEADESAVGAKGSAVQTKPAGPGATRGAATQSGQADAGTNVFRIA